MIDNACAKVAGTLRVPSPTREWRRTTAPVTAHGVCLLLWLRLRRAGKTVRLRASVWVCLTACLSAAAATAQDMPLSMVLIDGEDWELAASGFKFTEGPAVDAEGNLFFTDVPNRRIHKLDTLYVTSTDKIYRRKTQATGVRYASR